MLFISSCLTCMASATFKLSIEDIAVSTISRFSLYFLSICLIDSMFVTLNSFR